MPAGHTKKQKLKPSVPTRPTPTLPTTTRASLTNLPIEILGEILLFTSSPPTVVAVSRTCTFLYRTLALNPAAAYIWRGVRKTCEPRPLPELEDRWNMSEAEYAALVFSGGVCEVCNRNTRRMYSSFAVRARLCNSWHCKKKFREESIIDVAAILPHDRRSLWVPCVESNQIFRNMDTSVLRLTWPHFDTIQLRKTDWEKFQCDILAYEAADQTPEDEANKRHMQRCNAAVQRLPAIMELSVELYQWKAAYDKEHERVTKHNRNWTKRFAHEEGFVLEDLLTSQAYGLLQSRKNFLLEEIMAQDVVPIRPTVESELLEMQARRQRQKSEKTYKEKLAEVKKIYDRMRSGALENDHAGTVESSEPMVLPPLSVFCTLPSVRVLKGSPDPSALPPNNVSTSCDIKSSTLAMSLIIADVHKWLVPVRAHLMRLLGYPNGWQSASTRALPPLKRLTARFFCRRCGEGKVGRAYQRELCLDYKGVCSHVCVATQKKSIEKPREDVVEVADTSVVEQARGKKKKCTLDWKVDVFERDDKAIRLIHAVLRLSRLSEDSAGAADHLKGSIIRCATCTGWVVMDVDTAIGHAHRHDTMQVQMTPLIPGAMVEFTQRNPSDSRVAPSTQLEFKRGTCDILLGSSHRGRNLCKKVNYGCRHCIRVCTDVVNLSGVVEITGTRPMTFHGLRSHMKEKHGIEDVRDEDVLCFGALE